MKIERRSYASEPWRLVDDDGLEVCRQEVLVTGRGRERVWMAVRGRTKAACMQAALGLLGELMRRVGP